MSAPKTDRQAVLLTLTALQEHGYRLTIVWDGEEVVEVYDDVKIALDAVMAVDDAVVNVWRPGTGGAPSRGGWVFFVLGNDPEEVIRNHTGNLGDVLDPLMDSWWES